MFIRHLKNIRERYSRNIEIIIKVKIEYLLYSRHHSKCFTCIKLFMPYNSPMR